MIPLGTDVSGLVKTIREDIVHIDIPITHPLKNISLYLFLGSEPALVDTGPYHPLMQDVVVEALHYVGVNELSYIYLTHSHFDHFGMASRLRDLTGARVAAHRYERPRVEHFGRRMKMEYDCYSSMSVSMGFPEVIADFIFNHASIWVNLAEPCPVDIRLGGGETVRAGDRELETIHTPGHTAGHLCYLEREEGLLFSGDHLMRAITPNPELYCPPWRGNITGLPQFLDSLRLLGRYDITCAYPGHGRIIKRVMKRVDTNLAHHHLRLERTEEAVKEGCRTVWEVALQLFPQVRDKPPEVNHFLALKEALGHLLILEEKNRVRRSERGGIWLFSPSS